MIFTRTALRTSRNVPRMSQHVRGLYVDNTVNNNFPFKYQKKSAFIAKSGAFMGFAFAVPFVAVQFKKTRQ